MKRIIVVAFALLASSPAVARHHPYATPAPAFDAAAIPAYGVAPGVAPVVRYRHARHSIKRAAPGRRQAARQRSRETARETPGRGERLPAGSVGNTGGMNAAFVSKLREAFAAIPDGSCRVGSGFRSHAEQARLHRAKPRLAAAPGHSNHERGLAADLSCSRGALGWMHRNARRFGLTFPMSYEAWHVEPVGATRLAYHYRHRRAHYASAR